MLEALQTSRNLLKNALEAYLNNCIVVADSRECENTADVVSRSLFESVIAELECILNLENTLRQAKAAISRARNSYSSLVPIHILPSETMICIFDLALRGAQPCAGGTDCPPEESSKYPELLSHVCTRWRQIALGSSRLWSHIDIMPFHPPNKLKKLLARNEAFIERAGSILFELHVFHRYSGYEDRSIELDRAGALCISIAPRARSLRLVESTESDHKSTFGTTLPCCSPGILEELSLKYRSVKPGDPFIQTTDHSELELGQVNMSKERLEALLDPVKYLSLTGCYFPWTSRAYRGLTELRLDDPRRVPVFSIKSPCFEMVLAASPKLRILEFGLTIEEDLVRDESWPPTTLSCLEILRLRTTGWSQGEAALRLISPGPGPLCMFVDLRTRADGAVKPPGYDFAKFCERSNVTELCVKSRDRCSLDTLLELFRLSPRLRVLTLANFHSAPSHFPSGYKSLFGVNGTKPLPIGSGLDRLNLFRCDTRLSDIEEIRESLPIHTLGIEWSTYNASSRSEFQDIAQLSQIFSVVEAIVGKGFSQYWSPNESG